MTAIYKHLIPNSALVLRLTLVLSLLVLPVAALAGFDWDLQHTGSVNEFFEIEAFHSFVTNTGASRDTVMVNMVKNLPDDWVASLCEETLCYPPHILDIELILNPAQTTELIIDMTPITNLGRGSTDITLTSKNDPADTETATFAVITDGLDVLLVSGVGADEALISSAIAATGKTVATWDLASMGKTTAADLGYFGTVLWGTGAALSGLDADDMTNLTSYVAWGGHLLLSGQNLAYAYCDPASPSFDATACAWFWATLGADYTADVGSTDFVTGAAGDPIFRGATYNINGGSGSNNNTSPDVITPTGSGVAGLDYSGGGNALVSQVRGPGKTAFAAFGIEGISSATDRATFVTKVFTWFAGGPTAVDDQLQPVLVRRPVAWPNPFNPQTSIRFEVGGERAVAALVIVYDLQGRAVRHLFQGNVSPGPRSVNWDGRDDSGRYLATGAYLAQVKVDQDQQTVKMTLVK